MISSRLKFFPEVIPPCIKLKRVYIFKDHNLRVRYVFKRDIPTVSTILKDTFKEKYNEELSDDYAREALSSSKEEGKIRNKNFFVLKAKLLTGTKYDVGMASVRLCFDGFAFLEKIYIYEQYQCNGYGTLLLSLCTKIAYKHSKNGIRLYVEKSNQQAISFYEKFGFQIVNEQQIKVDGKFYDDYVMEYNFNLEPKAVNTIKCAL